MSALSDIVKSWHSPRAVIAGHLHHRRTEPFAFALLVTFLLLAFLAQWPGMARGAYQFPDVPLTQRMLATGLALLAAIPLIYVVAALSRIAAGWFGGKGSYLGARLALFAALLAAGPMMLIQGLISGFAGPGWLANLAGLVVLLGFLYIWMTMLIAAEG